MMDNPEDIITMVNVRGRVVRVRKWEVPLCREQGMRIITNPKQEYFPEYDQDNQRHIEVTDNIVQNITDAQILNVEVL